MKFLMKTFFAALTVALLCGCNSRENMTAQNEPSVIPTDAPEQVSDADSYDAAASEDGTPVTRAIAAKMIAIAFNDLSVIDYTDREIAFSDTSPEDWFDKYINIVYIQNFMRGSGTNFMPDEYLTVQQTQYLLDKLDPDNKIKLEITDPDMHVSSALWNELFIRVLTNTAGEKSLRDAYGIEEKSVITMATSGNNSQLREKYIITDTGPMTAHGINMDRHIDKEVKVLVKDGEIISALSTESHAPTIKNAYIEGHTKDTVTIFSGGAERTYTYANDLESCVGYVCDITIDSGAATNLTIYKEKTSGTIKKVDGSGIELEIENGENIFLNTADNFKVYSAVDGVPKWRSRKDLIVGADIAEYILKDGAAAACIIYKNAEPGRIRVAINTTGYNGLVHESVSLTGTSGFKIVAGSDTHEYVAWEPVEIPGDLYGQQRIYVVPGGGKIAITSVKRNWENNESPRYRGVIEIAKADGGFTVINEVSFEEYLYAVVPSEMPSSHGLEAAKVQAVTARSYAYNQYFANRYYNYGANIDDSVNCQVYNNIPENDTSIRAVDETYGQCLVFGGSVISANFFSTSAGMTANSGEVWANTATMQFPAPTSSFLKAKRQYQSGDYGDLSLEENADKFFKDESVKSFDSGFNWFRWNVTLTAAEITASINANLEARYNANPTLIKTLQPDGVFRSRPVSEIGLVTDMEALKRGEGGNIMSMKITAGDTQLIVDTEYNIRFLIRPYKYLSDGNDILLNRSDGSMVSNYWIMPSAFYTMDKRTDSNGIAEVTFYGGGNGHGVGMSQNGVKGMIDAGYAFEDILRHYYEGTDIRKMY